MILGLLRLHLGRSLVAYGLGASPAQPIIIGNAGTNTVNIIGLLGLHLGRSLVSRGLGSPTQVTAPGASRINIIGLLGIYLGRAMISRGLGSGTTVPQYTQQIIESPRLRISLTQNTRLKTRLLYAET